MAWYGIAVNLLFWPVAIYKCLSIFYPNIPIYSIVLSLFPWVICTLIYEYITSGRHAVASIQFAKDISEYPEETKEINQLIFDYNL